MTIRSMMKIFILPVLMLLAGCAGKFVPITDLGVEKYDDVLVITHFPQEEIRKQIIPSQGGASAGAQFGLVGALVGAAVDASVNSSRMGDAEEDIEKFRVALKDQDLHVDLRNHFHEAIEKIEWIERPTYYRAEENELNIRDVLNSQATTPDAVLWVQTDFAMTPDFQALEVTANYGLYNKIGKSLAKSKPLYKNQAIYQSKRLPLPIGMRKLTDTELKPYLAQLEGEYQTQLAEAKTTRAVDAVDKSRAAAEKKLRAKKVPDYTQRWLNESEKLEASKSITLKYEALATENPSAKSKYIRSMKKEIKALSKVKVDNEQPSNIAGEAWLLDNANLLNQALSEAGPELIEIITRDLRGQGVDFENYETLKTRGAEVYLVHRDDVRGRDVVRVKEGIMPGKIVSKDTDNQYLMKGLRL